MSKLYAADLSKIAKPVNEKKKPRVAKKPSPPPEPEAKPPAPEHAKPEPPKEPAPAPCRPPSPEKVPEPPVVEVTKPVPVKTPPPKEAPKKERKKIVRKPVASNDPPEWFKKYHESAERERIDSRPSKQVKIDIPARAEQQWQKPVEREKINHQVSDHMTKLYWMVFNNRRY